MINDEKKLEQLHKILGSNEFKDSKSYKTLLEYLVKASLRNEVPTETSIAIEGLNKKGDFDNSTDASVRVYIHNLRKKNASYYLNEGKNDPIRISVPKGQHYQVVFSEIKQKKSFSNYYYLIIFFTILLLNILFWVFSGNNSKINASFTDNNNVWNEFLADEEPVLLVIGDFFIFKDTSQSIQKYIRDYRINSPEELHTYNIKNEEFQKYSETEITFIGKSSVDSFPEIISMLASWNKEFDVKLASELTWDDVISKNIIFVGSFKTLRILKKLVTNLNASYRVYPNTIFYKDEKSQSIFEYKAPKDDKTGYLKDYALVAKLHGPKDNFIFLFTATHDIGQSATVNSFLSNDFLDEFKNNFKNDDNPHNLFEAIFEVKGFRRTGFHPSLIQFHELPDSFVVR